MKKVSIVPEILVTQEVTIFDDNGISVNICPKSLYKFNYNLFQPPSFIIDNFERRKYKDIEIKTINLDYLNKFGYRLVSISLKGVSSNTRNYSGQKSAYMLEPHTRPIPNSQIINNIPKDHFIEYDVTNSRIRIKGRNGFPGYNRAQNATTWITVIKK